MSDAAKVELKEFGDKMRGEWARGANENRAKPYQTPEPPRSPPDPKHNDRGPFRMEG
jgi:hypothetical protein